MCDYNKKIGVGEYVVPAQALITEFLLKRAFKDDKARSLLTTVYGEKDFFSSNVYPTYVNLFGMIRHGCEYAEFDEIPTAIEKKGTGNIRCVYCGKENPKLT